MEAAQEIFDVVRAGDVSRLQALLATNPGLANVRNDRGHSAVLIAQYHHRPDAVAALLAAGPDLDIFDAASVGRTERVAELLDRDPSLVNAYSSDGFYPLGLAAFFAHPDTVRLLLSRGADVAQVAHNAMKVQPLHAAAAGRSFEAVKLLVDAGAPGNGKQEKGWAPLHEAGRQGKTGMGQHLLPHRGDSQLPNDPSTSAIGLAAKEERQDVLKLLKRQG